MAYGNGGVKIWCKSYTMNIFNSIDECKDESFYELFISKRMNVIVFDNYLLFFEKIEKNNYENDYFHLLCYKHKEYYVGVFISHT